MFLVAEVTYVCVACNKTKNTSLIELQMQYYSKWSVMILLQ